MDAFMQDLFEKCNRLCTAARMLGNINVQVILDTGDVPSVQIMHHIPDYEICADPLKDTYDVWALSPRSILKPDISLNDAAMMLVASYTQAKRKMMRSRMIQQGTGKSLDTRLDNYFRQNHNGHLGIN
jgi:hypothetical protein